jgi:hypothetical protein
VLLLSKFSFSNQNLIVVFIGVTMIFTTLLISSFGAYESVLLGVLFLGLLVASIGFLIAYKRQYRPVETAGTGPIFQKSPDEDLEHALSQLGSNYELQRKQTMQGFIFALVMSGLGLIVILVGALGQMFGLTSQTGNLSVVAGVIVEFINATALLVYRQNFQRLNSISDKLNDTWKILTAFKQVKELSDKTHADKVRSDLIFALAKTQIDSRRIGQTRKHQAASE